jgi:hypothetical protein
MKPAELRIGNLVEYNRNVVECVDVMCDGINTKYIEGINIGFIQPIPLTEEWLLRFGFDRHIKFSNHNGWLLNGWFINSKNYDFMVLGSSVVLAKIKHIHQLQNLYFALTGEELTLKNK